MFQLYDFHFSILFLSLFLTVAMVNDLRFHKIPNWLNLSAAVGAILYNTCMRGFSGLIYSLQGVGVGIAVMMLFYVLGGMGAGDVKLMGAIGGFLGPKGVLTAFLYAAMVGGVYALLLLALHGYFRERVRRYINTLKTFVVTQKFIHYPSTQDENAPRLCYGVAIGLGTLFSCLFYGI